MISFLKELDQAVFLFLNSFHNSFWDIVMVMFTRKEIWLPLYVAFGILIIRKYRWKSVFILMIIILAIVFSDQFSVLIKESVKRLRPTHDPAISDMVHNLLKKGGLHGFFSSHASNAITVAFITSKIFSNKIYTFTIFVWALVVSYSRIYLGVHYPFDILAGIAWGFFTGYLFYQLLLFIEKKIIWVRFPKISETKLTSGECISFLTVLLVLIATIMLVVWKLQHYNFL
jgi:undecaprenyl-diphosphatase